MCGNFYELCYKKKMSTKVKKLTSFIEDEEEKACTSSKDAKKQATGNSMSNDRCRVSQSRRKQDLSTIHENNDDVMVC